MCVWMNILSMDDFKCLYIVDYICQSRYNTNIYSILVLFTECWGSNLSFQARVGKLNRDLLQPFRDIWSFSVRYLISLAYWKGLISRVKLSVVVPQAIGISLRTRIGDSAGEFLVVVLWGFLSAFNVLELLLFLCFCVGYGGMFAW